MPRTHQPPEPDTRVYRPIRAAVAVTCGQAGVDMLLYLVVPAAFANGVESFLFAVGPGVFVALPLALAASRWRSITSAGTAVGGAVAGALPALADEVWFTDSRFWRDPSTLPASLAVGAVIGWIGSRVFWRVWRIGL